MAINVGQIRRAARVSQVELAALTGIARTRISAAERGYIVLRDDEIAVIKKALSEEPRRRASQIKNALSPKAEHKTGTEECNDSNSSKSTAVTSPSAQHS